MCTDSSTQEHQLLVRFVNACLSQQEPAHISCKGNASGLPSAMAASAHMDATHSPALPIAGSAEEVEDAVSSFFCIVALLKLDLSLPFFIRVSPFGC